MPTTICDICKKDFKFPSKLKRHLQRKISCKTEEMGIIARDDKNYINLHQFTSININSHQLTSIDTNCPQTTSFNGNTSNISATFPCEYCKKKIHHINNYRRHLRTTCHKIPENIKKKFIIKYNENKKHINSLEKNNNNNITKVSNDNNSVINIKKLIINNDNTINNTLNNNNVNNDNTINNTLNNNNVNNNNLINNVNNNNLINNDNTINNTQNNNVNNNLINMGLEKLIINPMGKEDLSKLSHRKKKQIINSGKGMFKNMMNAILELPENWNFYILNRKEKIGVFLNKKNELEAEKLKLVLKESVLNYHNMIYDIYTDIENELTDKEKKDHNIEYNKMEPVDKNQLLEDTVLFKLVSISKKCKIALDKYMKILEEREELLLENN